MAAPFFKGKMLPSNFKIPVMLQLQVVLPVLMLFLFCFSPPKQAFALFVVMPFFALFHMHVCIGLTFDGFVRFSRYGISHRHPILDKILSVVMILASFVGFAPVALFLKAYSLSVSPDKVEVRPFYDRPYIVPYVQGLILSFFYFFLLLKYGYL